MGSIDIVVLVRKEIIDATPEALTNSLNKHWRKLVSKCSIC